MANPTPNAPETPRRVAFTRSFTVPSKLATPSRIGQTAEIGATEGVETLYVHPNASIVKFSTSGASRPGSAGSPRSPRTQATTSGALPWTSLTERTLAVGPLEIYRVPGSVSFLHSGTLLHAILPRSQCWCVDGISKFALRVLPDTYYRVELPAETPEDLAKVEELKGVLTKVLFYERTACPFNRGIEEALPTTEEFDGRKLGRRKSHGPAKKWRLERGYSWKPEDGEEVDVLRRLGEEQRRGSEGTSSDEDSTSREESSSDAEQSQTVAGATKATTPRIPLRPSTLSNMRSVTAPAPLALRTPPPSRVRTSVFLDGKVDVSEAPVTQPVSVSRPRLTPERLRTFQPIPTDMPPSPPDSSAGMETAETQSQEREEQQEVETETEVEEREVEDLIQDDEATDIEEQTEHAKSTTSAPATPPATQMPIERDSKSEHQTDIKATKLEPSRTFHNESLDAARHATQKPAVVPVSDEAPSSQSNQNSHDLPTLARQKTPEDPFAAIQARILARRSIGSTTTSPQPSRLSPTSPSSSSSSSASSSSTTLTSRSTTLPQHQNLAAALVKKACAAFLGPPAHLVALMLKIAAQFTKGAMGFGGMLVYESPAGSKRVPGSFNLESIDADEFDGDDGGGDVDDAEEEEEEWEEDDFGVPLKSPVRLAQVGRLRSEGGGGVRERDRRNWNDG